MGKRMPSIQGYLKQNVNDYTENLKLENSGVAGICEIVGNRPSQEDDIALEASDLSEQFATYSKKNQQKVIKAMFAALQKKCGTAIDTSQMEQGSCACIATGSIQNNKATITTSYVGDSVAFLVVIDANGKLIHTKACNPASHDGNNANEVQAIKKGKERKKNPLMFMGGKLLGLAVTRAIGDNSYEAFGLSHQPEITHIEYDMKPGNKAYMILGCDGIMEHHKFDHLHGKQPVDEMAKELGDLIAQNNKQTNPAELSELIVNNAYVKKSNDNISSIVIPLGEKAVTGAIFDGHGGSAVSKALAKAFPSCFKQAVLAYQSKVAPKTTDNPEIKIKLMEITDNYFFELCSTLKKSLTRLNSDGLLNNEMLFKPWLAEVKDTKKASPTLLKKMQALFDLHQVLIKAKLENANDADIIEKYRQALLTHSKHSQSRASILSERRWESRGVRHAAQVFFKALFLAIPALVIDLITLGKAGAYQGLFKVRGRGFVKEATNLVKKQKL